MKIKRIILTPDVEKKMIELYGSRERYEIAHRALEKLFSGIDRSIPLEPDEWIKETSGCISSGSKDILSELFKSSPNGKDIPGCECGD